MAFNIRKEDLRIIRTNKSLYDAVFTLLKRNCFRKITVGDICDEALISRATFYAHYTDKYNLLKYWLANLMVDANITRDHTYESLEISVNQFVSKNKIIIKNLIDDADRETLIILFDFILSYLNLDIDDDDMEKTDPRHIVLSNFFAGGMIYYLSWHVNNKFQSEMMNTFLYRLIRNFQEWGSKNNFRG